MALVATAIVALPARDKADREAVTAALAVTAVLVLALRKAASVVPQARVVMVDRAPQALCSLPAAARAARVPRAVTVALAGRPVQAVPRLRVVMAASAVPAALAVRAIMARLVQAKTAVMRAMVARAARAALAARVVLWVPMASAVMAVRPVPRVMAAAALPGPCFRQMAVQVVMAATPVSGALVVKGQV